MDRAKRIVSKTIGVISNAVSDWKKGIISPRRWRRIRRAALVVSIVAGVARTLYVLAVWGDHASAHLEVQKSKNLPAEAPPEYEELLLCLEPPPQKSEELLLCLEPPPQASSQGMRSSIATCCSPAQCCCPAGAPRDWNTYCRH